MRKQITYILYKLNCKPLSLLYHRIMGRSHFRLATGNVFDSTSSVIYRSTITLRKGCKNNAIIVGENSNLWNSRIEIKGSNNKVTIGKNSFLNGLVVIVEGDNNNIFIGDNAFILDDTRMYVVDGSTLTIGNGVMCSDRIDIRTTDNHAIIDIATNKRINKEEDIVIGDNVWIGTGVKVLKGANIVEGGIIGAGCIITRSVETEPNSIIAGSPAHVVRRGVRWTMER